MNPLLDRWFKLDQQFIKNNINQLKCQKDDKNLSAIHYSILEENKDCFELLLNYEKYIIIDKEIIIQYHGNQITIPNNTDVLNFCIIFNKVTYIKQIIKDFQPTNTNHLQQAILSNNDASILIYNQINLIQNEILINRELILKTDNLQSLQLLNQQALDNESIRIPFYLSVLSQTQFQSNNFMVNQFGTQIQNVAVQYAVSKAQWMKDNRFVCQEFKNQIQKQIQLQKDKQDLQQQLDQQQAIQNQINNKYKIIEGKHQKVQFQNVYDQEQANNYQNISVLTAQIQQEQIQGIQENKTFVTEKLKKHEEENIKYQKDIFKTDDENKLQLLLQQYNYVFNPKNIPQLQFIRSQCQDNANKELTQQQIQYLDSIKDNKPNITKAMIVRYNSSYDQRNTDYLNNQYNGFACIHYTIYFNSLQQLKLVTQTEFNCSTQSRVIIQAKGVQPYKGIQVPIGTTPLQLTVLTNRIECFQYLIEYVLQNKLIDKILLQQNEYQQNILYTLALSAQFCKQIYQNDQKTIEQIFLCILNSQKIKDQNWENIIKTAIIFNNIEFIKLFRQYILNNINNTIDDQTYSTLLFQVYQLLINIDNNEYLPNEIQQLIEDNTKQLIEEIKQLIQLIYIQRKELEQQIYDSLQRPSQRKYFIFYYRDTFQSIDQQIQNQKEELKCLLDQYQNFEYCDINCQDMIVIDQINDNKLYYLETVVQSYQFSFFFDQCIKNNTEFIIDNFNKYKFIQDRRVSNQQIVQGANCLIYAILNNNYDLVKFLLQQIEDIDQDEVEQSAIYSTYLQKYIIFNSFISPIQACLIQQDFNQEMFNLIVDYSMKNNKITDILYQNKQVFKLAIQMNRLQVIQNKEIIKYEFQIIEQQIKDRTLNNNCIFYLCRYGDINQLKQLNNILNQQNDNEDNTDQEQQKQLQDYSVLLGILCLLRYNNICACDLQPTNQFIMNLTDSALIYLLQQKDQESENILKQYYQEDIELYQTIFQKQIQPILDDQISVLQDQQSKIIEKYEILRLPAKQFQQYKKQYEYFEACKHGNIELIEQYIQQYNNIVEDRYTDVDNEIHKYFSGLMYAICYNTIDVVQYLLEKQKDISLTHDTLIKIKDTQQYFLLRGSQEKQIQLIQLIALTRNEQEYKQLYNYLYSNQKLIELNPTISNLQIVQKLYIQEKQLINDMKIQNNLLEQALKYKQFSTIKQIIEIHEMYQDLQLYILQDTQIFNILLYQIAQNSFGQQYQQLYQAIIKDLQKFVEFDDNQDIINQFFSDQNAYRQIQQELIQNQQQEIYQEKELKQIIEQNNILDQYQCQNNDNTVIFQSLEQQKQQQWLQNCKVNNQQEVYSQAKKYVQSIYEVRQNNILNNIARGFYGVHYAIINYQQSIYYFLVGYEGSCTTKSDSVYYIHNKIIFYPRQSSIFHIISSLPNQQQFNQIIKQCNSETILQYYNNQKLSVFQTMSMNVFNEVNTQLFQKVLEQVQQVYKQVQFCVQHSLQTNNQKFANQMISNASKFDSYLYKEILSIKANKYNIQNKTSDIYLSIYQESLKYACQYRNDTQFKQLLNDIYGDDVKDVIEEYLFIQNKDWCGQTLVNQINYTHYYTESEVNQQKQLKYFTQLEQTQQQYKWFQACLENNIKYIQQNNYSMINVKSQYINNYKQKVFNQYTGLMYAIVNNSQQIINYLIEQEGNTNSTESNLVQIQDGRLVYFDKNYPTTPIKLSIILHNTQVFNQLINTAQINKQYKYTQDNFDLCVYSEFDCGIQYVQQILKEYHQQINLFNILSNNLIQNIDEYQKYMLIIIQIVRQIMQQDNKIFKYKLIEQYLDIYVNNQTLLQQLVEQDSQINEFHDHCLYVAQQNQQNQKIKKLLSQVEKDLLVSSIKQFKQQNEEPQLVKEELKQNIQELNYIVDQQLLQDFINDEYKKETVYPQKQDEQIQKILDIIEKDDCMQLKILDQDKQDMNYMGLPLSFYAAYCGSNSCLKYLLLSQQQQILNNDIFIKFIINGQEKYYHARKGFTLLTFATLNNKQDTVLYLIEQLTQYQTLNREEIINLYEIFVQLQQEKIINNQNVQLLIKSSINWTNIVLIPILLQNMIHLQQKIIQLADNDQRIKQLLYISVIENYEKIQSIQYDKLLIQSTSLKQTTITIDTIDLLLQKSLEQSLTNKEDIQYMNSLLKLFDSQTIQYLANVYQQDGLKVKQGKIIIQSKQITKKTSQQVLNQQNMFQIINNIQQEQNIQLSQQESKNEVINQLKNETQQETNNQ